MERPNVAAAAGMVSVQADCTPDQALALITEHAETNGLTVELVAVAVIERVICLDQPHTS